jgi:hypothetical protein
MGWLDQPSNFGPLDGKLDGRFKPGHGELLGRIAPYA